MAANDIRVCDKCKHMRMKTAVAKLGKLAPDAEVRVGCKSYCGPCARYAFVFINGRYVKGATEDEAIEKAMVYLKK
ncbi:DUF1450 domain-containing protein [Paenibacillus sp. LHD-117]|uniref:DUF1450 domain-containing protein n=1 Tax=Paenibacillus sp. LHD-117 TaxID=3071412 RepID=UPI0027DF038A|nr:DUF1450 domain-containing protein [Paenibacillus sp. LHD-117]MDQ6421831.1 DUF1450 domain-containing protein [Paenibacillus sp. LHD-117]